MIEMCFMFRRMGLPLTFDLAMGLPLTTSVEIAAIDTRGL
jgi:hypothetical protein